MNAGAAKLERLTSKRGQKRALSLKLGLCPSRITRWARGEFTPSLPYRMLLKKKLGIALEAWDR